MPIYENTQADNTWELELDVGQYQADIFNSCGEEIQDYLIDIFNYRSLYFWI